MAFDPDAYLSGGTAVKEFDPDAYLAGDTELPEVVATEGGGGFLEKINAALRKPSPAWLQAPESAARELITEQLPHDLPSYLKSIGGPVVQGYEQAKAIASGDVSGLPLVGRVPEIMAAEETPAFSKERYKTALKTLMDVGALAGAVEGPRVPMRAEPTLAERITQPRVEPVPEESLAPVTPELPATETKLNRETLQHEPKTDRDFWFDGLDLRQSVVNGLARLGVDVSKTDLPSPEHFSNGKDFFYSMREAESKMRQSGAKAAGFVFQDRGYTPPSVPPEAPVTAPEMLVNAPEAVVPTGGAENRFVLNPHGGVFDTVYNQTVTPAATHPDVSAAALKALNESELNGKLVNPVTFASDAAGNPILVSDGLPEPITVSPAPSQAAPPVPVMSPGAAKQLGKLKAYVEKSKKLGQQVDPKVEAKIAEIEGVPPEAPVQAQEGPPLASEAPGGIQGAETPVGATEPPPPGAGAPPEVPPSERGYAGMEPLPETFSTKNAVTEARREALGLDPVEKAANYDFGPAWEASAKIMADDPLAGERLAKTVNQKPQAVDPTQNALLLRNEIAAELEHSKAIDAVNAATDEPSVAAARIRLAEARERVQTAYDASSKAGSATGAGLNARKMMADQNYNLARMEATVRAAKNGEPLSPPELAKVEVLHNKLTKSRESWFKSEAARQSGRRFAQEAASLLDEVPATKSGKGIVDYLDSQAAKARQRIIERRGRLNTGVDPTALTDEIIIGASHVARGLRDFGAWSKVMISEFGERIRPFLRDIYEKARGLHEVTGKKAADAARLATYKKGLVRRTEELRTKIETKDLVKVERQKTKLDREAMQMRADYGKARSDFDQLVERERLKNRTGLEKTIDTIVTAERSMKLTGITTLGKIASAGATRLVQTPIEHAIGGVISRVPGLARIAREAPTEGRPSLAAEIEAMKGVGRGLKQTKDILKGDKPTEEAFMSERVAGRPHVKSWLDIPGRLHGAIKNPVRASQYARAKVLATEWAERKGLDVTDPQVEAQIGEHAVQSGARAIFMQDNLFSSAWNGFMGFLEGSKKFPTGGYIASRVGRFLLPIIKVPTNVALETATHLTGPVTGTAKLIQVMHRGLKTIRPEEADFIMRHYKKGAIGAGLFFTGYFNHDKFGGYYRQGEKPIKGEPRYTEAQLWGIRIAGSLLHAPAFLVMQAGATFHKLTHGPKPHTKPEAAMEVANEIIHEVPFANELGKLDKLLASDWEGTRERGYLLRSTVVPQGVQNVTNWMTPKDEEGYPLKRYPQNYVEQIKMGLPGLREQVSTEKPSAKPKRPQTMSQRLRAKKAAAARARKKAHEE